MKTRAMRVEDSLAVATVHTLAWQHAYKGIIDQKFLDSIDIPSREVQWRRGFDVVVPTSIRLVLEKEGALIGFACGLDNRNPEKLPDCDSELWAIYVHPTHQRSGAGRVLFQDFCTQLRLKGKKRMCVWVLRKNLQAKKFYEKMGGQPASATLTFQVGGQSLEEMAYCFDL